MDPFLPWLSEVMSVITQLQNDPDSDAAVNVPCGSCQLCCHHTRVQVTEKEAENPKLKAVLADKGWIIPKNGSACIHLTDQGCGIYEDRPITCRGFDCRKRLVTNMVDNHTLEMNKKWNMKEWETEENQIFLSAIRTAAATYHDRLPESTISEIVAYAIMHWPEYLGAIWNWEQDQAKETANG